MASSSDFISLSRSLRVFLPLVVVLSRLLSADEGKEAT